MLRFLLPSTVGGRGPTRRELVVGVAGSVRAVEGMDPQHPHRSQIPTRSEKVKDEPAPERLSSYIKIDVHVYIDHMYILITHIVPLRARLFSRSASGKRRVGQNLSRPRRASPSRTDACGPAWLSPVVLPSASDAASAVAAGGSPCGGRVLVLKPIRSGQLLFTRCSFYEHNARFRRQKCTCTYV